MHQQSVEVLPENRQSLLTIDELYIKPTEGIYESRKSMLHSLIQDIYQKQNEIGKLKHDIELAFKAHGEGDTPFERVSVFHLIFIETQKSRGNT